MSRWSTLRRTVAPRSTLSQRRQYRHSKAAIHERESANWDQLEPLSTPPLGPGEIRRKRAELACEMVTLLLGDGELGRQSRQTLERIYTSLESVRRQL
jgi:hypothetical protein